MQRSGRLSWYIGFDCPHCAYPIPVFRAAAPPATIGEPRVMCPQCGACERQSRAHAYPFQAPA